MGITVRFEMDVEVKDLRAAYRAARAELIADSGLKRDIRAAVAYAMDILRMDDGITINAGACVHVLCDSGRSPAGCEIQESYTR